MDVPTSSHFPPLAWVSRNPPTSRGCLWVEPQSAISGRCPHARMPRLLCSVAFLLTACGAPPPVPSATVACRAPGSDEQMIRVRRDLVEGEQHLRHGNFQQSIRRFRAGLAELGNAYATPYALDDTGQRLVLGRAEERAGHVAVAAHLLRGVLSSRLSLCAGKLESPSSSASAAQPERRPAWNS